MNKTITKEQIIADSRVLIVDDSKTIRMMLRHFCQKAGFTHIEDACDGKEGLEKILSSKPDLVFIDMEMPNMTGLQVCQELQRLQLCDDLIIIMQTMLDNPELKEQAFDAGITDFVTKPLNEREVIARSRAHLERHFLNQQKEADYLRMQAELKEATILQNILLPNDSVVSDIRTNTGLDIAHYYHPASELAGDYLSVRKLSSNRVALISADVSGHGVKAALYAFSLHTLLEDQVIDCLSPGEALMQLNANLCNVMTTGNFVTLFLGIIDTDKGHLQYAAAAAPPPILKSGEKITLLNTDGHLLGTQKTSDYATNTIPFAKGDTLFLYSDVLTETPNQKGEFMQEQEMIDTISNNGSKDASAILKTILASFYMDYSKNPTDDLSMLVCKA